MLLLALMIAGLAGPDTAYVDAAANDVYQRPVVSPYEPYSDFGRQIAEGDADASVRARTIRGPVAVDAYRDSYERRRSRREITYDEGVSHAQARAQALMGPLDGAWRATDAEGRHVLDLVLSDRGGDIPLQGALSVIEPGRQVLIQPLDAAVRVGDTTELQATVNGKPVRLMLRVSPAGGTAVVSGLGHDRVVTLSRTL